MSRPDVDLLRRRFLEFFDQDGVTDSDLDAIEAQLGLELPPDLREISHFYGGGLLGGISHHAISSGGPADNVVDETKRLRRAIHLPEDLIVLAEPPGGLIVARIGQQPDTSPITWCSESDISHLFDMKFEQSPTVWPDYSSFFQFLLDAEAEERLESGS